MSEKEWLVAGQQVIRRLKQAGFEAYFVGGCVRDLLLGRKISDIDIVTSALPTEMKQIFEHVIPFGEKHGTIVVREACFTFEITTYRGVKRQLAEDLRLRDFTMNALAMDEHLQLIDLHGFYKDIEAQVIRLCPPASNTLHADPLRMLRAVRFYSQLYFQMDEETLDTIQKEVHLLSRMPIERVASEIEKLWAGIWRKQALELFLQLGFCLPNSFLHRETIIQILPITEHARYSAEEFWSLIAIMQRELSWKHFPIAKEMKQLLKIIQALYERRVRDGWSDLLLYDASLQYAHKIERCYQLLHPNRESISIQSLNLRYKQLPIHSRKELAITGADMMKHLRVKPGSWIETMLRKIERAIIEGKLENRKERLLHFVESEWRKL